MCSHFLASILQAVKHAWAEKVAVVTAEAASARAEAASVREEYSRYRARAAVAMRKHVQHTPRSAPGAQPESVPAYSSAVATSPSSNAAQPFDSKTVEATLEAADTARNAAESRVGEMYSRTVLLSF